MRNKNSFLVIMLMVALIPGIWAQEVKSERCFEAAGKFGAVSTGNPLATNAAIKILNSGGNAVDAAVAAGFMLGVVDFSNSGIGGDGFALVRTSSGQIMAWDGSIKRPGQMTVKPGEHPLGLPTVPEMLLKLLRHYGSRSRAMVLAPAISTCIDGFKLSAYLEKAIEKQLPNMTDPSAVAFLAPDGFPLRAGQVLKQPLLAQTLKQMVHDGGRSFYRGEIAEILVQNMRMHGSEYQSADLANYRSQPVKPVRFDWLGYSLYGPPPPSSSVATLKLAIDLLNSGWNLFGQNADEIINIAMLGRKVIGAKYSGVAESIVDAGKFSKIADAAESDAPPQPESSGGTNTTHLCVWDRNGMAVSMTLTLGSHFGTGQFSPAGFFYNNGLRNFSKTVGGYPPDYPINAGPVSAKSPVLITHNNRLWLAIGGAGSNRIIFNTALAIARCISQPEAFTRIVKEPRFFLDYNRKLYIEWNPDQQRLSSLKQKWPELQIKPGADDYFGLVSAILASGSQLITIADHRRDGSCAAVEEFPMGRNVSE